VPEAAEAAATQTSAKGAAAATQAAGASWYVKTDDGEDYGPVSRRELDQWASEGRLNADCQLLKDGSEQWQWATDLYPALDPEAAATSAAATAGAVSAGGEISDKKKMTAALLGILLGAFGVHRFYLGYTGMGVAQILVTCCTCVGGWWGVIEGIMILTGSFNRDALGRKLAE
jgi:TM2 domain-containing membrane protein YozV